MNTQQDFLTQEIALLPRRRTLLPVWIKIFIWLFMIFGAIAPLPLILGVVSAKLAIFGFESHDQYSPEGLLVMVIFVYNGIVAYKLWTEQRNAVELALYAAYLNGLLCITAIVIAAFNNHVSIRLELVLLVFFISKLKKIKELWEMGVDKSQSN